MKILILYPDSIDDAIFFTPVVRALKAQIEPHEIHALIRANLLPAVQDNPYIDSLITEGIQLTQLLRAGRYDLVVDCSARSSAWMACRLTRTRRLACPQQRWEIWLMTRLGIDKLPNRHITERMLTVLDPLGVKPDDLGLDFFIPPEERVSRDVLPPAFRDGYDVFYISAPYDTRRLPVARIIELCDRINWPVVLLGDEKDRREGERIRRFFEPVPESGFEEGLQALNKRTRIFNGVGRYTLHQVASLVRQASRVFTFDSVMVPLASALRKPVVVIMGNTIPSFGRFPYKTRFTVLEVTGLPCRPCTSKGYGRCPKGHFRCMMEIALDF